MIESIQEGKPLTYRVQFPLQRPIPLITRVSLNDEEHCSGERGKLIKAMFFVDSLTA